MWWSLSSNMLYWGGTFPPPYFRATAWLHQKLVEWPSLAWEAREGGAWVRPTAEQAMLCWKE